MGIDLYKTRMRKVRPMDTDVREASTVWLIVRRQARGRGRPAFYHIQAIATDEEKAVALCRDASYIIGPFPVNVALPEQMVEWKGSYCPLAQEVEDDPARTRPKKATRKGQSASKKTALRTTKGRA
jgi:hypothetical protein